MSRSKIIFILVTSFAAILTLWLAVILVHLYEAPLENRASWRKPGENVEMKYALHTGPPLSAGKILAEYEVVAAISSYGDHLDYTCSYDTKGLLWMELAVRYGDTLERWGYSHRGDKRMYYFRKKEINRIIPYPSEEMDAFLQSTASTSSPISPKYIRRSDTIFQIMKDFNPGWKTRPRKGFRPPRVLVLFSHEVAFMPPTNTMKVIENSKNKESIKRKHQKEIDALVANLKNALDSSFFRPPKK